MELYIKVRKCSVMYSTITAKFVFFVQFKDSNEIYQILSSTAPKSSFWVILAVSGHFFKILKPRISAISRIDIGSF